MKRKVLSIDFDYTIHLPGPGYSFGTPIHGSLFALRRLEELGYTIVIFTARTDFGPVREWLKKFGFRDYLVTNKKIPSEVYIDDRAIHFSNWKQILQMFD